MSNDDPSQDTPEDEQAGPPREPTEGVRILGAQEASEATGRHQVVRRGRLKRFGDRPDGGEAESDLPKITISSTEEPPPAGSPGDQFGAVPVVPPAEPGGSDEPGAREPGGHARVAGDEPLFEEPEAYEPAEGDDTFVLPHWTEPATGQVPKVVADTEDEPPDLAGGAPRWRDEADDDRGAGFDDLTDDQPLLGALSGSQSSSGYDEEDEYGEYGEEEDEGLPLFDGEAERDPLEAFGPVDADEEPEAPRRRRREPAERRRPRPPGRGGGGGGADRSGGGERNLPVAVAVGVGLLAVGLLCFFLGTIATMLLATAVVGLAGFEYFTAVRDVGYNPATLVGLVALGGLVIGASLFGLAAYPVVLGITVLVGLIWFLVVSPGEGSVANLGITLLGVMWIGFLGSFAGLFLGLGDAVKDRGDLSSNPGIGVLIAAVVVAVAYDIGGFFVGQRFGRTPLSDVSPNKTQEGLGGGIIVAVVATFIVVSFIAPIGDGIFRTFVFALLCAIAAPVGDLCESFIKRDLGIKDMGSVLPAHGGILDRFDSMLFVLPVAYFVSIPLGIWSA